MRGRAVFERVRIARSIDRSRLKRNGSITVAGSVIQGGLRFITSVLIGRIGGPVLLGTFSTAVSSAQLFALLGPSGAGSAAAKFIPRELARGDLATARAIASYIERRMISVTSVLAVSALILWVLVDHRSWNDAVIVAFMVFCYSGYSIARGFQYATGNVSKAVRIDVCAGASSVIVVLVMLLAGVRNLSVLIPIGLGFLVYTAAGWPVRGANPPKKVIREINIFVVVATFGTLASAGFMNASVIVARANFGAGGAGYYSAALALATPTALLASALSLVLFPAMAAAHGEGGSSSARSLTDTSLRVLVATMIALFGSLVFLSEQLVSIFWGSHYIESVKIVPFLLLAVMMNSIGVACTTALTSGSQRGMLTSAASSFLGMAAGGASWTVLVPLLGLQGVACGYMLGTTLIAFVPLVIVWHRDKHVWLGLALTGLFGILLIAMGAIAISYFSIPWPGRILCLVGFLVIWVPLAGRQLSGGWIGQVRLRRKARG